MARRLHYSITNAWPNERRGVDAGLHVLFAFQCRLAPRHCAASLGLIHRTCMPDALTIAFKNEESSLEVRFTPGEGRTFDGLLRIHQRALDLSFLFSCFGYDLAEFARELESFHSRYEGSARFRDQSGEVDLEFALVHPVRGTIGITATLGHWVAWPADWKPVRQQADNRSLIFQGFTIEQSYLPSLVTQVRQFLAETGVSTVHPMIHEERP